LRQHFGGHGFACAAAAGEQRANAWSRLIFLSESARLIDFGSLPDVDDNLVQQAKGRRGSTKSSKVAAGLMRCARSLSRASKDIGFPA
jgi:hypothetical protein